MAEGLPADAVEAAAMAQHGLENEAEMGHSWDGCEYQDSYREVARVMLAAAAPALRRQITDEIFRDGMAAFLSTLRLHEDESGSARLVRGETDA